MTGFGFAPLFHKFSMMMFHVCWVYGCSCCFGMIMRISSDGESFWDFRRGVYLPGFDADAIHGIVYVNVFNRNVGDASFGVIPPEASYADSMARTTVNAVYFYIRASSLDGHTVITCNCCTWRQLGLHVIAVCSIRCLLYLLAIWHFSFVRLPWIYAWYYFTIMQVLGTKFHIRIGFMGMDYRRRDQHDKWQRPWSSAGVFRRYWGCFLARRLSCWTPSRLHSYQTWGGIAGCSVLLCLSLWHYNSRKTSKPGGKGLRWTVQYVVQIKLVVIKNLNIGATYCWFDAWHFRAELSSDLQAGKEGFNCDSLRRFDGLTLGIVSVVLTGLPFGSRYVHQTLPRPSMMPRPWIVMPLSLVNSSHCSRPDPHTWGLVGAMIVPSNCEQTTRGRTMLHFHHVDFFTKKARNFGPPETESWTTQVPWHGIIHTNSTL